VALEPLLDPTVAPSRPCREPTTPLKNPRMRGEVALPEETCCARRARLLVDALLAASLIGTMGE
jgi:hypothetical protein